MTMGLTAERVAEKFGISREEQDEFSYESHQKAVAAIAAGRFKDEIAPSTGPRPSSTRNRKAEVHRKDPGGGRGSRADTSVEAWKGLKPAFKQRARSRPATAPRSATARGHGDGRCPANTPKKHGLKPIARLVKYAVAGVPPEIMGIGPAGAIPQVLQEGRAVPGPDRPLRAQRGLRRPGLAVIRELKLPTERSTSTAAPSPWAIRSAAPAPAHAHPAQRAEAAGRQIRRGLHVHRRRHGRRRRVRNALNPGNSAFPACSDVSALTAPMA